MYIGADSLGAILMSAVFWGAEILGAFLWSAELESPLTRFNFGSLCLSSISPGDEKYQSGSRPYRLTQRCKILKFLCTKGGQKMRK